jgi:hypothetical protein
MRAYLTPNLEEVFFKKLATHLPRTAGAEESKEKNSEALCALWLSVQHELYYGGESRL